MELVSYGVDKKFINFQSGNVKVRDRLGVVGIDERIILKWILKNMM
jgi:transposase-like protein